MQMSQTPPLAPNGAPYGWPLALHGSVQVGAGLPGLVTIQPLSPCWLTSLCVFYIDPAAPQTLALADVRVVSADVRGEIIYQDQGALGHFCAPVNGGMTCIPPWGKHLRLDQPMLLAANDTLTVNVVNLSLAARQVEVTGETYRYVEAPR